MAFVEFPVNQAPWALQGRHALYPLTGQGPHVGGYMSRREREAGQMWATVILSLVCLAVQTVPDWSPQVTVQGKFLSQARWFQYFEGQYYLGQNLQVC